MPLNDFLRQSATILQEAPDAGVPPQDALGGADRSGPNWVTIATGVPCLVCETASALDYAGLDQRRDVVSGVIYFAADPVPNGGLTTRHRIKVEVPTAPDRTILGTYAVTGVVDPNAMGRIFKASVQRGRTP